MRLKAGDKAPQFQALDIHGQMQTLSDNNQQATLLSFHRHAGCPPCNLRVREQILAKKDFDRYGVQLLGVFESPADSIRRDLAHGEVPFPILPDSDRQLYELYSVSPSLLGFLRSFLVKPLYSIKAIFKHGYIPKFTEATTMMPAEFLIAPDSTVILSRYSRDFGDHLSMAEIFQALENHLAREER